MLFKLLMFLVIIVAAHTAQGQNNQQQKALGRVLNDQKLWQQSKMPTYTIYKNNFSYQVPMFPGQRFYQGNGLVSYENKTVPKADKTILSFNVKYPTSYPLHKNDSINIRNKSYVRFK